MARRLISGGTVYDPAHGVDGQIQDVWIEDGTIVAPPRDPESWPDSRLDASGYVVMPGGIDLHCHIAGPKVNAARQIAPELARGASPVMQRYDADGKLLHSGGGGVVPTAVATGALFAGLGYTTAMDAAVAGLLARQTHLEFQDIPNLDKGLYLLFGNNHFVMDQIRQGHQGQLDGYLAWGLNAARGYTIKIVNPGGVESYKQISRKTLQELDEPVPEFAVTPRQIVRELAAAADRLGLPHSIHLHCNNLGIPGNWETTLRTMQALEGHRAHLAHIQFHSYGGDRNDPKSFCSAVDQLFDYVKANPQITLDVGHVNPGRTLSVTGDAPFAAHLQQLTGGKLFSADTEGEASCGIIPGEYRPQKSLVHAVQWAIALEWYLLMLDDPWRVALTSDHPNGGAFYRYPEIIHLLMDSSFRREALKQMPADLPQRSRLAEIDREYSLYEIAIITRAAPARILGLTQKGHLGPGADADVTIYSPQADRQAMFQRPRWVFQAGELVVLDGEICRHQAGRVLHVAPEYDDALLPRLQQWFNDCYSIRFANYALTDQELGVTQQVATKSQ